MLRYPPRQFPLEFVQCVFQGATDHAIDNKLVEKGTRALVELSTERGAKAFIPLKDIIQRGETENSPSGGLWIWLKDHADLLEKKPGRRRAYRIRGEFYKAMLQQFGSRPTASTHSIVELEGLGKEIWEGIDPKEYIEQERKSWDG